MKGKLLILLLVGVLSFCVKTLQGFAYSDELSKYFALKLGAFIPNRNENVVKNVYATSGGLKNFDTGINLEFVAGKKISLGENLSKPYLATELSVGYYGTSKETYFFYGLYKYEEDVGAIPVGLTGKVVISLRKYELYGGAGIDAYYTFYEQTIKNIFGVKLYSKTTSSTVMGYHFVGGVNLNLSRKFAVGLELKWNKAEPKYEIKYEDYPSKKAKINYGGTFVNFFVKWNF